MKLDKKPTHTQGPWFHCCDSGHSSKCLRGIQHSKKAAIHSDAGTRPTIASHIENWADARLIAASPTAYEILSDLREWFTGTAKLDGSALIGSTDKTVRERIAAYFAAVEAI